MLLISIYAHVTSPMDEGICGEFCDYFQKFFTRVPGLSTSDLPYLKETEAVSCNGCITEEEIWEVLNVEKDMTLGIDGLLYKVYLKQPLMKLQNI